jgi:hypothetical protein
MKARQLSEKIFNSIKALAEEDGASIEIKSGIVYVTCDDGSVVDFTIPMAQGHAEENEERACDS